MCLEVLGPVALAQEVLELVALAQEALGLVALAQEVLELVALAQVALELVALAQEVLELALEPLVEHLGAESLSNQATAHCWEEQATDQVQFSTDTQLIKRVLTVADTSFIIWSLDICILMAVWVLNV